ncbi:uncharacterized protein LOC126382293 [Pectinophora gossypiella]|uniref:uncharacterized protein LOC126382293 n=1 Tax=Pectinophora gossypiella TaxID=13191 RepID=UPI00214E9DE7|nr:uncharacterized protein LOC126382293 [Pectinophora gossypiella]
MPKTENEALVEVRAVFINCETSVYGLYNDISRFQRQELFKHNALRDCSKKLALTVKMTSDPLVNMVESVNAQPLKENPGDEYLPIDHVFEGTDRKRVRLLNPYILRLRRESPRQAYKLRRIDTISGFLTNTDTKKGDDKRSSKKQVRSRRDMDGSEGDEYALMLGSAASVFTLEHEHPGRHSYSVRIGRLQELIKSPPSTPEVSDQLSKDCVSFPEKRDTCPKDNETLLIRDKRHKTNEEVVIPSKIPRTQKDRHYQRREEDIPNVDYDMNSVGKLKHANLETRPIENKKKERSRHGDAHYGNVRSKVNNTREDSDKEKRVSDDVKRRQRKDKAHEEKSNYKSSRHIPESDFNLYEIGAPYLWYNVKVQLFEKLTTPEGKTVWNDLTKGSEASVSSSTPEWKGPDLNVRYRSAEWVPRDDFTLPTIDLCLLEPYRDDNLTFTDDDDIPSRNSHENYIVVPVEDIIGLEDKIKLKKRYENESSTTEIDPSNMNEESHRRVEVRVSRAIFGSSKESFAVSSSGDDRFLTLPFHRPHHAQIDLEVRADDNQLVRVGSSARISTIVADNTRKKRTTLTLQATNTGLASARFKAVARECGPELTSMISAKGKEEISAGPILLPPQHTRRLHLDVPFEVPVDITHCNVALVNDDEESVAVREVTIRKGDRCFCVWHCDCVCLSEDPKLLCREMSQSQQVAAGLSTAGRPRHARSVFYNDDCSLNILACIIGVFIFLALLSLIKASVGLLWPKAQNAGMTLVIKEPPVLKKYHEPAIACRAVEYDDDGWPIHPDTKERTVLIMSKEKMFILNATMFLSVPGIILFGLFKKLGKKLKHCAKEHYNYLYKQDKYAMNAQEDVQSVELVLRRKRRRDRLRNWMTPLAEELTKDVFQEGLTAGSCPNELRPLLHDQSMASKSDMLSCGDSEQDDTDYVLMQMQKSRESLARSQKKITESALSSDRNLSQAKDTSTNKR